MILSYGEAVIYNKNNLKIVDGEAIFPIVFMPEKRTKKKIIEDINIKLSKYWKSYERGRLNG